MTDSAPTLVPFKGTPTHDMQQWALSIVHDPSVPYGGEVTKDFDGRQVTARVEHHTWTMKDGVKVPGHYRGVTLYEAQ